MIFNFKKLIKNFGYAFEGLKSALSEQTFRIFCFMALFVIALMFLFGVTLKERIILILIITFLLALELINSQIERALNIFQPNYDPKVKVIKDISAGAVFLASLGAAIIGILIFWPYFRTLFL